MTVSRRYERVREAVRDAAAACGRPADSVRLIAVSKTVGIDAVEEALRAGACDFGENRPDELVRKARALPECRWHFIGNIQSRRIPDIVEHAWLIHSLHAERHARRIDAVAAGLGKVQDVLVEVNVSGEESKSGVAPEEALGMVRTCCALAHVRVRGLMTMAPQGDLKAARRCFAGLARLRADIASQLDEEDARAFDQLSAGMSEDWPCAIEEGSTMVRVGRAIFSDGFRSLDDMPGGNRV